MKVAIERFKKSSLFRDSFWALFGNVVGKGFSLFAGIAVARFLGRELYGEYGIIKSSLLMIALFSSFGLGITSTKFVAETKEHNPSKLYSISQISISISFLVSTIISLLVIAFADHISVVINAPHLASTLKWASFAIILNSVNTTQLGILGGFKAYNIIAKNNIIIGIFTFLTTLPLSYFYGFNGSILSIIISLLLSCLKNQFSIHKLLPQKKELITKVDIANILSLSFPIAMNESLYSLTAWLSSFVLIKIAGYGELGILNAATQWMAVMAFVPGALRNVALSHFSTVSNDKKQSEHLLIRLLQVNFFSTMTPCIFVWIFSNVICSLYGEQYDGMQSVLNVLVFAAVIMSLSNIITQELIALDKNWFLFCSRFIKEISFIVVVFYVLKSLGGGAFLYACLFLFFHIVYLIVVIAKFKLIK